LEFAEGEGSYRWYGEHVGDYPLPEGFEEHDLGRCDHVIRLTDAMAMQVMEERRVEYLAKFQSANGCEPSADVLASVCRRPYEIGVAQRRDGKPGWVLLWDFWQEGFGLQKVIGENANRLKQSIATAASIRTMRQQGYKCERKTLPSGAVQLQFVRG